MSESFDVEMYKENIIDHYKNPRNIGIIKNADVIHREVNPLCGDEITLYLKIEDEKIVKASFVGVGCAISQASISLLTNELKGKLVDEARAIPTQKVIKLLGIPISHTRMKCALLSWKTLTAGLERQGIAI
jgi:nitrogen fixation protein NifU and related proteins